VGDGAGDDDAGPRAPAGRAVSGGTLYLVATPIGNLGDITARAVRVLRAVDLIAAEDTRRSGRLLRHLGITGALTSYYDAVEESRAPALVRELQAGKAVALISDAGTPGIADPGYRLVRAALAAGVPVVPVPGPSAVTAFLPASGLPTDRFVFEGFLPARQVARRTRLAALAAETRTLVFFEAGRRLAAALADMAAAFGARPVAIGRELTKLHEEIVRGDLVALAASAATLEARGEVVIGVGGAPADRPALSAVELDAEIRTRRAAGATVRDLAAAIAAEYGLSRRAVYQRALALTRDP
jgi:16S rRNA (cytidine1402-2'-O)-methyltransferase